MSRDIRPIFASIDGLDADSFVAALTEDVVFTFGNNPSAHGRAEIKAAIEGFWTTIAGLSHHIQDVWEVDDVTIVNIQVEYRRLDGNVVTVPNVDILRWDGDLVADWRILIDLAPVFAPAGDLVAAV